MKPNELRIGNFVMDGEEVTEVDMIWSSDSIYELTPIPLTIELLKKAGFKYYEAGIMWLKYKSNPRFLTARTTNGQLKYISRSSFKTRNIKHLHELQNYFFILTGEELNIEL